MIISIWTCYNCVKNDSQPTNHTHVFWHYVTNFHFFWSISNFPQKFPQTYFSGKVSNPSNDNTYAFYPLHSLQFFSQSNNVAGTLKIHFFLNCHFVICSVIKIVYNKLAFIWDEQWAWRSPCVLIRDRTFDPNKILVLYLGLGKSWSKPKSTHQNLGQDLGRNSCTRSWENQIKILCWSGP